MIYEYFSATGSYEAVQRLSTLFAVRLRNDDVQDFDVWRDHAQKSVSEMPSEMILEELFNSSLQNSFELETVLALYDQGTAQSKEPNYQQLKTALSVSILAQATSCSNVRGVFLVHEPLWFCFVQVSISEWRNKCADISGASLLFEYGFSWWFSSWLWRSGRSFHKYDGGKIRGHPCNNIFPIRIASRGACIDFRVRTGVRPLLQAVLGRQPHGIYLEILIAPQPLDPMALDLLQTTGTQDEDLILFQALKMNMREVTFYLDFQWTIPCWCVSLAWEFLRNDQRIFQQAYQNTLQNRFCVIRTRIRNKIQVSGLCGPAQRWWHPLRVVDSPFWKSSANITVRQSDLLEDREIGKRFAPLWRVLSTKLQEIFLERDAKDVYMVPAFHARSQVLSILDRRNEVEKQVL